MLFIIKALCKCPNCLVYKFVKFLYFCIYCLPRVQMELFLCADEQVVCPVGCRNDGQAYFFPFIVVATHFNPLG